MRSRRYENKSDTIGRPGGQEPWPVTKLHCSVVSSLVLVSTKCVFAVSLSSHHFHVEVGKSTLSSDLEVCDAVCSEIAGNALNRRMESCPKTRTRDIGGDRL
jgi:hypothetical protein